MQKCEQQNAPATSSQFTPGATVPRQPPAASSHQGGATVPRQPPAASSHRGPLCPGFSHRQPDHTRATVPNVPRACCHLEWKLKVTVRHSPTEIKLHALLDCHSTQRLTAQETEAVYMDLESILGSLAQIWGASAFFRATPLKC